MVLPTWWPYIIALLTALLAKSSGASTKSAVLAGAIAGVGAQAYQDKEAAAIARNAKIVERQDAGTLPNTIANLEPYVEGERGGSPTITSGTATAATVANGAAKGGFMDSISSFVTTNPLSTALIASAASAGLSKTTGSNHTLWLIGGGLIVGWLLFK